MPKLKIGLGQARRLTQMKYDERLQFIAEGLPIIVASAAGFLAAAEALKADRPRETDVLKGFAEEEAAKALILIDIVRCPPKLVASKIGTMIGWFYDHLARLIYAKASSWRPTTVTQLQEYVNHNRATHYLDGNYSEYIFPNQELYFRESRLYADVGAHEDGRPYWNEPKSYTDALLRFEPPAYRALSALAALGAFSSGGLKIVADTWAQQEFRDAETHIDAERLVQTMLERLVEKGLPTESATHDHVAMLYGAWQMPMYNIDLRPIETTIEELQLIRDSEYPGSW